MKRLKYKMSFLFGNTQAAKHTTPTNTSTEDNFHVVEPFVNRPRIIHSDDDEETVVSVLSNMRRVPSDNSMPGLVSDSYDSDLYDSETEERVFDEGVVRDVLYMNEPIRLVNPSKETLENLRDGLYDLTFESGDRYVGQMKDGYQHGRGKYTYSIDSGYADVQEGLFENDQFIEGVFHTESYVAIGTFENDENDIECLEGENCQIEWCTGIKYNGPVEMDEPYADGDYTIPEGTLVEFEGQSGVLTHRDDRFYVTFQTGPIYQVSSEDLDCIDLTFFDNSSVRVQFRDGCVFEGIVIENDQEDDGSFTVSGESDYNNWDEFQSMLWLMANVNDYPVTFFDRVQTRGINLRQLMKFKPSHWKLIGLDRIQSLQLKDTIEQLNPEMVNSSTDTDDLLRRR